jgi:hypothetical protein
LRNGQLRRGSNLSEEFTRPVAEEVDWEGALSDDDEDEPVIHRGLGLEPIPDASPPPMEFGRSPSRYDRAKSPLGEDGLAISLGRRGRKGSVIQLD